MPATLTKIRFAEGVWEGRLDGMAAGRAPQITASHEGRVLEGVAAEPLANGQGWHLRVPVPSDVVGDGLHTILLSDADTGARLGSIAIAAGDPLAEDMRAELDLLRAELDLLKRAFRRHCAESETS